MAKGNLFLGTAARSVGDVVMYRREGAQVSRVRVRKIANPKTDAQCLQRAFMSACVKFYQPLANVLDRSWQGKSRAKSYAAFLKTNAPKVRAAGYYIPKGSGFIPLPLQVSEGTVVPFTYDIDSAALIVDMSSVGSETQAPTTIGTLSSLFIDAGYKSGDIITIILVSSGASDSYRPFAVQFELDSTNNTSITQALPGITGVQAIGNNHTLVFEAGDGSLVAGTIIVARNVEGVWQRSKQIMDVLDNVIGNFTSDAAKTACIESYKGAAASDNPLVYLDGDELTD